MQHLLILNARRRVFFVNALKRYFLKEGLPVGIASTDTDTLDPIKHFVDRFTVLPPITDKTFSDFLCSFIEKADIRGLMVWYDADFPHIAAIRKRIEQLGVSVLLPSFETINICNDKRSTDTFMRKHGILVPEFFADIDEVLQKGSLPYPLIVKPYDGAGSMHVYKVKNTDELKVIRNWVPNPIAQKYIEGVHYTVDVFNDLAGKPISVVPRTRIKVRDSESLISKIEMKSNIIEIASKVASLLGEPGPMNVQLIEDENGNAYVIEVNARIGGGTDLTIQAGAPFHIWTAQLLLGMPINPEHTVQDGLIMTRYYESIFTNEV
ncbi:ATP-grasp domain-containing protein [Risungbinella massiliensis]|uniref:ATP-grasp domain-containing protein n=1 Tax=Risungbinella massiliensis TaxID=1329796 RepID=UPI0005CBC3ED|nr:ATP-grasp domain-containing protein [Risungbinella massiliensis]